MQLDRQVQDELTEQYQLHAKDTQSTDIQVAILTERIQLVQEQLERSPYDRRLRLLLLQLVDKRRRLLNFLAQTDHARYMRLKEKVGLAR